MSRIIPTSHFDISHGSEEHDINEKTDLFQEAAKAGKLDEKACDKTAGAIIFINSIENKQARKAMFCKYLLLIREKHLKPSSP